MPLLPAYFTHLGDLNPSTSQPDADSDPDDGVDDTLIPRQTFQKAGVSMVSFDGLLQEPLLLHEDLKEGCGGRLWPAGILLAKYLLRHHRSDLADKSIVELGAGGGLVGLAVARGCDLASPSSVYITDQEPMLSLMKTNVKLNNLSAVVTPVILNWGEPLPDYIPAHPTVVLAADCVYLESAFPLLVSTLKALLVPGSVCYFCFKKRRRADIRFFKLARKVFDITEIRGDSDVEMSRRESIFLYTMRARTPRDNIRASASSSKKAATR